MILMPQILSVSTNANGEIRNCLFTPEGKLHASSDKI